MTSNTVYVVFKTERTTDLQPKMVDVQGFTELNRALEFLEKCRFEDPEGRYFINGKNVKGEFVVFWEL